MKVTVENKKGLNKDLKVFIDKKTMNTYMDKKYEEIKGTVNLKGFRPGKVPREILKRQFGKAVFSEVLDKVLKDTSTKALEENKIKPAGQPKLDLKSYGEDKDLEYIISVTELPKIEVKSIENIKFDDYSVKIDDSETDKRIKEIAKNQPSFKEATPDTKAKEGDLVIFDYTATVDEKTFKGNEGKNTQLTLGKDLFLKGFDKQLLGVKKGDEKIVEAILPENFPEKDLVNKKAKFNCKISIIKNPEEVKINDEFAKNLGAKDLKDLKLLIFKQINDEYKNSLDALSKNQILKEIEKFKVSEIPENLLEDEIKILSNFSYKQNIAYIHTDERAMPKNKKAWSSWNSSIDDKKLENNSITYWLNLLQNLKCDENIFLTLNPYFKIDEKKILKKVNFTHPYYDQKALDAQSDLIKLQNKKDLLFCGSYFGYGFHEDGIKSSIDMLKFLND